MLGVVAVAVLISASWWAWLGWDTEQTLIPGTSSYEGPFEAWQVIGCGVCMVMTLAGAVILGVRPVPAAIATVLSFTISFAASAVLIGGGDGLLLIGLIMGLAGASSSSAVVAILATAYRAGRFS